LLAAAFGCAGSKNGDPGPGAGGAGSGAGGSDGGMSAGGEAPIGGGGSAPLTCLGAEGPGVESTTYDDGEYQASVAITGGEPCAQSYSLSTTQPLRADAWGSDPPPNPRVFTELDGQPIVRTGNDMFDALYALSIEEARAASVDSISNYAFDDGNPVSCPPGGCFETGKLWTYVWTRDTAYAVMLGLAPLDPPRARASLDFKLSERRAGGGLEIVQDTGTGGSWPVSSDRVVWALGAWEALKWLDGPARTTFRDRAYEAMKNTADRDRLTIYDPKDGLYFGEQSFLDWREQSYPGWVAGDPAQIAGSKTLSTNVGHLRLLEIAAALATEKGLGAEAAQYQGWADELRTALGTLWIGDDGLFSTYRTSYLDGAPARRYDLLGQALVVIAGVGHHLQRAEAVASYPHLPKGPAVIWPQQQFVPVYHNRGIWPFVTALWGKAARQVRNSAAIDHAVRSLMRGAALNLSNMENFEAVTGAPWLDDGEYSGPVINSTRQLWSVAGYASMVHDLVFGLEASQTGIRFAPLLPQSLREALFGGMNRIALSNLRYRGKRIMIELVLGDAPVGGALSPTSVTLDGREIGDAFVAADEIADGSVFSLTLGADVGVAGTITELSGATLADYQTLFGPRTPAITGLSLQGGDLALAIDLAGESPGDVTLDVHRDGALVASGLPGSTTSWIDTTSTPANVSHCYTLETRFVSSGTRSQRAKPVCWWGPSNERITTIGAQSFVASGGTLVLNYGKYHYEGWGDPGHTLQASLTVAASGSYLVQLVAGNGGPVDSGITCALKKVEVKQGNVVVASGYLAMPHLGDWATWRESTFLPVDLQAGVSYTIVIGEDEYAFNMSELDHFSIYGGTGGKSGRFNRVNIAEIKLLATSL
jgi:hypothetical protein